MTAMVGQIQPLIGQPTQMAMQMHSLMTLHSGGTVMATDMEIIPVEITLMNVLANTAPPLSIE